MKFIIKYYDPQGDFVEAKEADDSSPAVPNTIKRTLEKGYRGKPVKAVEWHSTDGTSIEFTKVG